MLSEANADPVTAHHPLGLRPVQGLRYRYRLCLCMHCSPSSVTCVRYPIHAASILSLNFCCSGVCPHRLCPKLGSILEAVSLQTPQHVQADKSSIDSLRFFPLFLSVVFDMGVCGLVGGENSLCGCVALNPAYISGH